MKILMVCLGNICRSPLADGIMRAKLDEKRISAEVDSCGTAAYHVGEAPDSRMIATAKARGVDISMLQARQFSVSDYDIFNRIYVMDRSNYKNVIALARNEEDKAKVSLLLSHSNSKYSEVPDPYYGGQDGFDLVFDLVEDACENIAQKLNG